MLCYYYFHFMFHISGLFPGDGFKLCMNNLYDKAALDQIFRFLDIKDVMDTKCSSRTHKIL